MHPLAITLLATEHLDISFPAPFVEFNFSATETMWLLELLSWNGRNVTCTTLLFMHNGLYLLSLIEILIKCRKRAHGFCDRFGIHESIDRLQ
jgi:hypothetical protein